MFLQNNNDDEINLSTLLLFFCSHSPQHTHASFDSLFQRASLAGWPVSTHSLCRIKVGLREPPRHTAAELKNQSIRRRNHVKLKRKKKRDLDCLTADSWQESFITQQMRFAINGWSHAQIQFFTATLSLSLSVCSCIRRVIVRSLESLGV